MKDSTTSQEDEESEDEGLEEVHVPYKIITIITLIFL